MRMEIDHVGRERQPVVRIDRFSGHVAALIDCAAGLRRCGQTHNNSPAHRRPSPAGHDEASRYLQFTLRRLAPVLERAFNAKGFRCLEASFSMVTTPVSKLRPQQRAPHFDSLDPGYVAILHYLTPCAGTAFYRQRATGIERLTAENLQSYRDGLGAGDEPDNYIVGSNARYEQTGRVDGVVDRMVLYRGALLHSGIIPDDPAATAGCFPGRLTANIFVHLR